MINNATGLLFDFTEDNLNANKVWKENMLSGRNGIKDIVRFEK